MKSSKLPGQSADYLPYVVVVMPIITRMAGSRRTLPDFEMKRHQCNGISRDSQWGGANAERGGANAEWGGANAERGGANAERDGANAERGGANAEQGGANAMISSQKMRNGRQDGNVKKVKSSPEHYTLGIHGG